jgi:hypothetical protein
MMIRGKGGHMEIVRLGAIAADTKSESISGGDDHPAMPKAFII